MSLCEGNISLLSETPAPLRPPRLIQIQTDNTLRHSNVDRIVRVVLEQLHSKGEAERESLNKGESENLSNPTTVGSQRFKNVAMTGMLSSQQDGAYTNTKYLRKSLWYLIPLLMILAIIISIVAVYLLWWKGHPIPKPPPHHCSEVRNSQQSRFIRLNMSAEQWNFCGQKENWLVVDDTFVDIIRKTPEIKCAENVKILEVYPNSLLLSHYSNLFDKFPLISTISFIRCGQYGQFVGSTDLRLRGVTHLRFIDFKNCPQAYKDIQEMFDMPCLQQIDFECNTFSDNNIDVVRNLTSISSSLSVLKCEDDDSCVGTESIFKNNANGVEFQRAYCDCS